MDNFIRIFYVTICMLAFGLLASCTHLRKDGPPSYNVDVSRIPDAVPKREPLAKYGNMSSYKVYGKRYYTLGTSRNYDKVGVASWYGTKFHAHKTSSGERYDMLSMTAAHKTLPLPTYVEVTNLKNNNKVIVKVNDRGPFSSNRIIDLSYVAAKKLGMIGRGTTKVRVRAIDPDAYNRPTLFASRSSKTPVQEANSEDMYLQVGAFKTRTNAEHMKHKLANMIATPIQIAAPTYRTKLYRVKVGPIKDVATFKHIAAWLNNQGIKSHVIS